MVLSFVSDQRDRFLSCLDGAVTFPQLFRASSLVASCAMSMTCSLLVWKNAKVRKLGSIGLWCSYTMTSSTVDHASDLYLPSAWIWTGNLPCPRLSRKPAVVGFSSCVFINGSSFFRACSLKILRLRELSCQARSSAQERPRLRISLLAGGHQAW